MDNEQRPKKAAMRSAEDNKHAALRPSRFGTARRAARGDSQRLSISLVL